MTGHKFNWDLVPQVSPVSAGLRVKCPRCGRGPLFKGLLDLAPGCPVCGLDYANLENGDGPAAFIILLVGFIVVGGALYVEVNYQPEYWVHAAIWLPTIVIGSLVTLRPAKALLIALQFQHKAAEGQLADRDDET